MTGPACSQRLLARSLVLRLDELYQRTSKICGFEPVQRSPRSD